MIAASIQKRPKIITSHKLSLHTATTVLITSLPSVQLDVNRTAMCLTLQPRTRWQYGGGEGERWTLGPGQASGGGHQFEAAQVWRRRGRIRVQALHRPHARSVRCCHINMSYQCHSVTSRYPICNLSCESFTVCTVNWGSQADRKAAYCLASQISSLTSISS